MIKIILALLFLLPMIDYVISAEQSNIISIEKFDPLRPDESTIDMTTTGSVVADNDLLKYCFHISDKATEARNAIIKDRLLSIEIEVAGKLDVLDAKISELKKWTARRDAFLSKANDALVKIFQTMRPDAAAAQFTEIGPALSAAIISKLEPKYSSAILTEMKPVDAAKIASVLTSVINDESK